MKECVFCNIINTGDNKNNVEKNIIVYEDELIFITQATGSPVAGYLMIVPKKHINGFAEMNQNDLKHVENVIDKIKKMYNEYFKISSILLEHGSTKKGRHPQSIVHAHIHLIPFNFNKNIEKELFKQLKLKEIKSLYDINVNIHQDYWLYCNQYNQYFSSANIANVPRSIFMNLIAKQIGLQLPYEWRKSVTKIEYINEIVNIFQANKDFIHGSK